MDKESALRGVLTSWARTDPEAAISHLDLLQKLPDAKGQDPVSAIVRGLSEKEPLKAMDFAIAHTANQNERARIIAYEVIPKLAATMKPVDFVALMDRAGSVKGEAESGGSSYSDVLLPKNPRFNPWDGYASFPEDADPAGSFRQLTGGTQTAAQKATAAAMAQQWAQKDTPGALAAWQSATDPAIKEMLSRALLVQAGAKNDLSLLGTVEAGVKNESNYFAEDLIRRQANTDPAKLLAWAEQLPADSRSRSTALNAAIGTWASYDTGKAIEYAQQRPAEEQAQLFATISRTWANSDSYGNSQWVASLPQGINRDNAASSLIAQLSAKEPQSALTWARSVGDESIRSNSYQTLFNNWARRDPVLRSKRCSRRICRRTKDSESKRSSRQIPVASFPVVSMKGSTLFACLGLPACFAAGYAMVPAKDQNARGTVSKPRFESATPLGQGIKASAVLKEIRDGKDPLEARLKLLSLIENATPGDLERIFNSARLTDDLAARNAAAQHWAEIDPAGFFSHLKGLRSDEMDELSEVASILFRTWAHRDPEEALAAAVKVKTLPGFMERAARRFPVPSRMIRKKALP